MGARLMAIVAEGDRGRCIWRPRTSTNAPRKLAQTPEWRPEGDVPGPDATSQPALYGLTTFGDLFTDRQLVA